MKRECDDKKKHDHKKKHDWKKEDYGIFDCNVVGFAVALANVTASHYCNAQANAAVLVAGDDINAKFENHTQVQDGD